MYYQTPYMREPRIITIEEVQWYLDENKKLILAILENKNLKKLDKCAEYQERLQQNLMYLAAIADWKPRTPAMPPQQMTAPPGMQPEYYMQHPQDVAIAQQQGIFPANMPSQFDDLQQQIHQQAIQGQIAPIPGWIARIGNGMYPMHSESETSLGVGRSGSPPSTAGSNNAGGEGMQGGSEGGDGQGNSAADLSVIVSSYLKD